MPSAWPLIAFQQALGTKLGSSPWLCIDQSMIDQFATLTRDQQFIHVDPVRAATTPLGGTIAHGYLTLSLTAHLAEATLPPLEGAVMTINYGFDRLRFLHPVRSGSKVRAHFVLAEIDVAHPQQVRFHWDLGIEVAGVDKPAMSARWITMAVLGTAPGT
jgi:acyl dehydratase